MYRRGIARIEDRWAGTGQTGERFRDRKPRLRRRSRSLRPRLPVRTALHRAPADGRKPARQLAVARLGAAAILERQKLVAELRDKLDLQRDLAVTGEELRARLNPESLVGWAESKARNARQRSGTRRRILLALAFLGAIRMVDRRTQFVAASCCVLLIEIIFPALAAPRIALTTSIEGVSCNAEGLVLFARYLATLRARNFYFAAIASVLAELQTRRRARFAIDSQARANRILDRRAPQPDRPHARASAPLSRSRSRSSPKSWRRRHGAACVPGRNRRRNRSADLARNILLRTSADPFPHSSNRLMILLPIPRVPHL